MTIKRVLITEAKEGMILANDVFDESGRLILPKETKLDDILIHKLENYSIFVISILDGYEEDKEQEVEGYYEKLGSSENFKKFEKVFNTSVLKLRNDFTDIVDNNSEIDPDKMLEGINNIINMNKESNMLDMLNCMRGYDDLTYVHSISVALICNVMSDWFGLNEEDKKLLTFAGLLHDVGKLKIPKAIIVKPDKLTEAEYRVIKFHPKLGYEILKNTNVDERVKLAALMHHERYDGTGYPSRLKGSQIDEIAKMVAIADVYDAMTANRVYREGMCPFDVIEHFQKQLNVYDPQYLLKFLEHTAETYVSNKVKLSNGMTGKVALVNKSSLGKPVVITDEKAIDLSKEDNLKIIKML